MSDGSQRRERTVPVARSVGPLRLNLSVDEAAAALGVSSRLLRSFIARGELPVVRIARRVLIPYEALAEWNRQHSTEASS